MSIVMGEVEKKPTRKKRSRTGRAEAPKNTEEVQAQRPSKNMVSIDLPSGFAPYTFKEFWVRPMDVDEVTNLQPVIASADVDVLGIANVLQDATSVRLDKLTHGDFWFVCAWLRLNSFPNAPFQIPWTCLKCNHKNKENLRLDELEMVDLDEDYKEPANLTLPSGIEIPLRLHRVEDEQIVLGYVKALAGRRAIKKEELIIPSRAISIMNGQTLTANIELIKTLDPEDVTILGHFQTQFAHGLPRSIKVACKEEECEFTDQLLLNFRISDIIPKNGYRPYIRDHIRFG